MPIKMLEMNMNISRNVYEMQSNNKLTALAKKVAIHTLVPFILISLFELVVKNLLCISAINLGIGLVNLGNQAYHHVQATYLPAPAPSPPLPPAPSRSTRPTPSGSPRLAPSRSPSPPPAPSGSPRPAPSQSSPPPAPSGSPSSAPPGSQPLERWVPLPLTALGPPPALRPQGAPASAALAPSSAEKKSAPQPAQTAVQTPLPAPSSIRRALDAARGAFWRLASASAAFSKSLNDRVGEFRSNLE